MAVLLRLSLKRTHKKRVDVDGSLLCERPGVQKWAEMSSDLQATVANVS